jgi:hypothetical protein
MGGLLAGVFGLLDWFAIPAGTRAKAVGLWHAGGNVVVLLAPGREPLTDGQRLSWSMPRTFLPGSTIQA